MRPSVSMIQPLLPSQDVDASVAFYRALGFEIVRDETFPYRYAEVRDGDLWMLTSSLAPYGGKRAFGAFIVNVQHVGELHDRYAASLRNRLGAVPLAGLPRLTRRSRDGGQFRVFDPSGNMLVYLEEHYEPPVYLDAQNPTEEIFHQVWFLRDIYANDRGAAVVLDRALKEGEAISVVGRARLLAARAEIAVAMGDLELAGRLEAQVILIRREEPELREFEEELQASRRLRHWAGIEG